MLFSEKKQLKQQLEEEYRAQLEENAREMEEMKKSYEEKLKQSAENEGEVCATLILLLFFILCYSILYYN